jgi:amino acid permease
MAAADTPKATVASTMATILNNTIGAGLLALPYTFMRSSMVTGALSMVVIALLNGASMVLLARCCELSGAFVYKDQAARALGPRTGILITAVMAVYTLGSCVSYVVLLGDFLPQLMHGANAPAWLQSRPLLLCFAGVAVLFPLSLARQLNVLKYTATAALVCILYSGLMVMSCAAANDEAPCLRAPASDVKIVTGGTGVFISWPVHTVAFCLHYNSARCVRRGRWRGWGPG